MNEMFFPQMQEESGSLPDSNTAEAILYGPSYGWIKSALWAWDEMEDYLIRKADSLDSQIMNREWAYSVMTGNRYLVFARSPPVNEVSKLKDLFTLRALCKCVAGLHKIGEYRRQNLAWARMKGIQQYVGGMEGRGISESEWKAATASYNMEPINYDYVHGLVPSMMPGEFIDWNEALRDLMGGREYDGLVKRIFGIDISDVPIGVQADGESTPQPEPAPDGIADALDVMFDDPVADAVDYLETSYDECAHVSEFWEDMDVDDWGIVDYIIESAEALS